jgi:oxalate decarboxylase/phosphoglucose isomerase-like protein (cupin superfamily)
VKLKEMKFRLKQQLNSFLIILLFLIVLFFGWNVFTPRNLFSIREEENLIELIHSRDQIINKQPGHFQVKWPPLANYNQNQYPEYRTLFDVVSSWNPDKPDPPSNFVETLQHFNYSNPQERKMAEVYRNAEVPFKLYNVPEIDQVSQKWSSSYLSSVMSTERIHVEKSKSNHFMYWTKPKRGLPRDFVPPTELIDMKFDDWLSIATHADQYKLTNESSHYYYMIGSRPGDKKNSFVARDLPVFSSGSPNFFITNPSANKGIQCRFAMRGIISECHYDSGKNMIAMMHGAKRYILTPPHTCKYLGIISDKRHPSFRHSVIDWSDLQQAAAHNFDKVDAIDTIVQEGEVLYVPSFWFHYIIAMNYAIQCNSRSGFPKEMNGVEYIESRECMNTKIASGR